MYEKYNYVPNHIWNCNEFGVQASHNVGGRVLAQKGSHYVYGLIPKAHEWMLVLACFNAIGLEHTSLIFTFSKAIVACIIT